MRRVLIRFILAVGILAAACSSTALAHGHGGGPHGGTRHHGSGSRGSAAGARPAYTFYGPTGPVMPPAPLIPEGLPEARLLRFLGQLFHHR